MKHFLTLCLAISLVSAKAQLLTLTDESETVTYNSTLVDVWGAVPDGQMDMGVTCVLNTATPKVVNMRRYEIATPAGITLNSYCWYECYNSDTTGDHPLWPAPGTVTMFPGTPDHNFHAYFDPNGNMGVAYFRFVWFNDADETDSVWMDIRFHATPVGINEVAAAAPALMAYPDPSNGGPVTLAINAPHAAQRMTLRVHNALGECVRTMTIGAAQRSVVIGPGDLTAGVWFATLEADGRAVSTKRFVIAGH